MTRDEEGHEAGWVVIAVFVVLLYVLRALFAAADQSK